jgi:endonuclease/exonuclease/phosphatase family metal-dependent hydrolase
MRIRVGTFNLNNLFSRWNFQAEIDALEEGDDLVTETYSFTDPTVYSIRTFMGRLVRPKDPDDTARMAERIAVMDCHVLAVQEVEDIGTLRRFNQEHLGGRYRYQALVEGNDPRLIDVGVLSELPLGGMTSWQHAVHPDVPERPVFSRDLLQVQVWDPSRSARLLTVYTTHLKSHFVPFGQDELEGARLANELRARQASSIATIVAASGVGDRFAILGDMNDPPDSTWLEPLVASPLGLVNALEHPTETRPPKEDVPPPPGPSWTYRHKESGEPAVYSLYDHIWLSADLAGAQTGAWIERRTTLGPDGSDHDPAFVELELPG